MVRTKRNAAPRHLEFKCPDCSLSCRVDTVANTVQHQLPVCRTYSKTSRADFIELAGVGMLTERMFKA
jgi:hypothetical protein